MADNTYDLVPDAPEGPLDTTQKASPRFIGVTAGGQEVIGHPDGSVAVVQPGFSADNGIQPHEDAPGFLAKNAPKLAAITKPVQPSSAPVPPPGTSRDDPEWQKWYTERQRKIAAAGANDAETERRRADAERSVAADVNNARMTADMAKRNADKGGPLPMTDAELDAETAHTARANDLRRAVASGDTEAVNRIQNRVVSEVEPAPESPAPGTSILPAVGAPGPSAVAATGSAIGSAAGNALTGPASTGLLKLVAGMGASMTPEEDTALKNAVNEVSAFTEKPLDYLMSKMKGSGAASQALFGADVQPPAKPAPPQAKVDPSLVALPGRTAAPPSAPATPATRVGGVASSGSSSVSFSRPGVHTDIKEPSREDDILRMGRENAQAIENQAEMDRQGADARLKATQASNAKLDQLQAQESKVDQEQNDRLTAYNNEIWSKAQDVYNTQIDPMRSWKNSNTGQRILMTIGNMLYEGGKASNHQSGPDLIEQMIERDVNAQLEGKKAKSAGLQAMIQAMPDIQKDADSRRKAAAAMTARYMNEVARGMEEIGLRTANPKIIEKARIAANDMRVAALETEQKYHSGALDQQGKVLSNVHTSLLNKQLEQDINFNAQMNQFRLAHPFGAGQVRNYYGIPVQLDPQYVDPKEQANVHKELDSVHTSHQATSKAYDEAVAILDRPAGPGGILSPAQQERLSQLALEVTENARGLAGKVTVPTSELAKDKLAALRPDWFMAGGVGGARKRWDDMKHLADVTADAQFTSVNAPPLSEMERLSKARRLKPVDAVPQARRK